MSPSIHISRPPEKPVIHYGALERSLHFTLPTRPNSDDPAEYVFAVAINDCTGLTLNHQQTDEIYLRTPREMRRAAEWLRQVWENPEPLDLPGFSPEFDSESVIDVYDASRLYVPVLTLPDGLILGHPEIEDAAICLYSPEATLGLAEAIEELARRWEDPNSDLFVSDIPTPEAQS